MTKPIRINIIPHSLTDATYSQLQRLGRHLRESEGYEIKLNQPREDLENQLWDILDAKKKQRKKQRTELDYLTRKFVRGDCGTNGATFSDEDCDLIIQEVKRLHRIGEFHHTGVYWVANKLAAEGLINPEIKQ